MAVFSQRYLSPSACEGMAYRTPLRSVVEARGTAARVEITGENVRVGPSWRTWCLRAPVLPLYICAPHAPRPNPSGSRKSRTLASLLGFGSRIARVRKGFPQGWGRGSHESPIPPTSRTRTTTPPSTWRSSNSSPPQAPCDKLEPGPTRGRITQPAGRWRV